MWIKVRYASGREYRYRVDRRMLRKLYLIKGEEGLRIWCLCRCEDPPEMTVVRKRGRYHLRTFPDQKKKHGRKCRYFRRTSPHSEDKGFS